MSTTIEVNKSSVKELLTSGSVLKFLIPEYQRPYAWSDDEVITLFNDIIEYTANHNGDDNESSYFLGCIVSFDNEGKQEIIDGQQRITTLFLLLRAIHKKLASMKETKETANFKTQIEPAIWKVNKRTAEADFNSVHIESKVMDEQLNEVLENILRTGETKANSTDRYSLNYNLLTKLLNDYAQQEPFAFYDFIHNILNECIVLPIKADSQETALTIFSTLNNRGLPLSDADIFKAKIYDKLDSDKKEQFIEKWKNISSRAEATNESIQKLFYYYSFFLRANDNDKDTTTPGLRKYFSEKQFERLQSENLLDDLESILEFWEVVNSRVVIEDQPWTSNQEILRLLDMLSSYPNEFWRYPVIIYYLKNKNSASFEESYLKFLRKLFVNLFRIYCISPTVNAVKGGILNLNASIIHNEEPKFVFKTVKDEELIEGIRSLHIKAVRMLLKLLAYNSVEQKDLLPAKWEIEHILPIKHQSSFYLDESEEVIRETIETIGNKIPFEKRLNVQASNQYFAIKQNHYAKSSIAITKELSKKSYKDWRLEDIRQRNEKIIDEVISIFKSWDI